MIEDETYDNAIIKFGIYKNCIFTNCTFLNFNPDNFLNCEFNGVSKNKLIENEQDY